MVRKAFKPEQIIKMIWSLLDKITEHAINSFANVFN